MTIPKNIYIEDLSLEDVRIVNIILIKKKLVKTWKRQAVPTNF